MQESYTSTQIIWTMGSISPFDPYLVIICIDLYYSCVGLLLHLLIIATHDSELTRTYTVLWLWLSPSQTMTL